MSLQLNTVSMNVNNLKEILQEIKKRERSWDEIE